MESFWASLSSAFVNFSSFRMQQPDFWLTCRNIHTYPTTCGVSYTGFQLLIVLNARSLRWFGRLRLALLETTLLNCAFQLALRSASRNDFPSFPTTTRARRDFSIAAPRIWNTLPSSVRATNATYGYM